MLFIDQKRYKITEIEFYVNDFKYHLDTFASSHHLTLENTKGNWLIRNSGVEITIGKALQRDTLPCGTIKICGLIELPVKNETGTPNPEVLNTSRKVVKRIMGDDCKTLPQLLKKID